jgi:hypothetical protein
MDIMGGIYSHQKVAKCRYFTHINIRQGKLMINALSALGNGFLHVIKTFSTVTILFLYAAGKKILLILKELFLRLLELFRYNPLIRKTAVVTSLTYLGTGVIFLVFYFTSCTFFWE